MRTTQLYEDVVKESSMFMTVEFDELKAKDGWFGNYV